MTTAYTGRGKPARGWNLVFSLLFISAFVGYVVWSMSGWIGQSDSIFLAVFFGFFATITTMNMLSGLFWRSFTHLPVPEARVVALVPIYEERNERVQEVVWALINQTRPPDHIYVMDDGSEIPLQGFDHPKVTWLRQENQGKRHAQTNTLKHFSREDYDLILTVDSDSVFDLDAVEHLMRPFSREDIHAATAMIYTRNWKNNLMTRLTDINLQTSCLQMRMLRSHMGIVSPTSGAIAMYRPWVLYDNLHDYLNSGNIGDDRRLSFYALMKGQVVTVNEAACETHLPETPRGIFKQRTRWAKSAWLGLPFVIANMRPWFIFWYAYPLLFQLLFPLSVIMLSFVWIMYGVPTLLNGVAFWFVTAFAMTGAAYQQRPSMRTRDKLVQMSLALLYPVWGLLLLRASGYKALLTIRDQSWGTRGADAPEPEVVGALNDSSELAPVIGIRSREVA